VEFGKGRVEREYFVSLLKRRQDII
jgi:hypothetical protein